MTKFSAAGLILFIGGCLWYYLDHFPLIYFGFSLFYLVNRWDEL